MKAIKRVSNGLLLVLVIAAVGASGCFGVAGASFDQETIEPNHGVAANTQAAQGFILDVTYEVISGPSIDAYLCGYSILLLLGAPSDYLLFDNDASSGHWEYAVPASAGLHDYAVVFVNDHDQNVVVQFTVVVVPSQGVLLTVVVGAVVSITITIVTVVAIVILVRRRRRKKASES